MHLTKGVLLGFGLLVVLAGCGRGEAGTVYVIGDTTAVQVDDNLDDSYVLQFSTVANGSDSRTAFLTGATFSALAADGRGSLYVGSGTQILVYGLEPRGAATPKRTIRGTSTGLIYPVGALAVDGSGSVYAYANVEVDGIEYSGIRVFAPTADGDVAPIKVIGGNATGMNLLGIQIAVDSAGNIYVPGGNSTRVDSVLIFNSSAAGNVLPTAVLSGSNTLINEAVGVALDSTGNIYVGDSSGPSILEFSAGSTGNVAPIRTISGPATTLSAIGNLTVDGSGDIYILNDQTIVRFAPDASGNVAPAATIRNYEFGLSPSHGIAVH
jgi:hypothetical protein